jgi:hypothetical protein
LPPEQLGLQVQTTGAQQELLKVLIYKFKKTEDKMKKIEEKTETITR